MRRKITKITSLLCASFTLAFLLFAGTAFAATQNSSGSGDWSSIFTNTVGDSYNINNGDVVTLDANRVVNGTVTVQNGGTLIFSGENNLSGTGTFVTQGACFVEIQSVLGFNSTSTGNLRMSGSKSFSSGASYTFNGSSAQFTGSIFPTSMLTLTIDNPVQVDVSNSITVTSNITLTSGELHIDTPRYVQLNLGGTFTVTENLNSIMTVYYNASFTLVSLTQFGPFVNAVTDTLDIHGVSSSYINGRVRLQFSGASDCYKIPFGYDGFYYPIEECLSHNGSSTNTYEFEQIAPNSLTGLHSSVTYVNPDYYYHTNEVSVPASLLQQGTTFYWFPYNGFYYGVSNLEAVEYNHNAPYWRLITGSSTTTGDGFHGTHEVSNNSQLREDYTIGFGSPVPVKLISFTGDLVNTDVFLKWETAMEINNDYFIVEKSIDGVSFNEIGRISGAGSSDDILDYMMIDPNIEAGVIYYRLVQVDYNNDREVFGPVVVNTLENKIGKIITFPNPTVDAITVTLPEMGSDAILIFIDVNGKEVYNQAIDSHRGEMDIKVDVSTLPRGIYFVRYGNLKAGYINQMIQLL